MTRIIRSVDEWLQVRQQIRQAGQSLGFVPTMGALHKGHASLIEKSLSENAKSLVSIFVNPTQFNNSEDLANYPKTMEEDLALLNHLGVNYLFLPEYSELYADQYRYKISESEFSQILCGQHRPGHFDGVLTVVMKLLNLAQADRAYFGEKDYQQLQLIKEMVDAFFVNTQIIPCPTVREADGLAMSSRNLRLTAEQREIAPALFKLLNQDRSFSEIINELTQLGFQVDYLEEHWGRRFVAASLGSVRLIDNVPRPSKGNL